MRILTRFFILVLMGLILVSFSIKIYREIKLGNISLPSSIEVIPIINLSNRQGNTLPDWTEEELLRKINDFREERDLAPFVINEILSNAAKTRLAVILDLSDYEGTISGITREKSLENVGYQYSWIGDLSLFGFYKNNDPIGYWESIKNASTTLGSKNLKEIGIAIRQGTEQVDAYLIFASKSNPVPKPAKVTYNWGGPDLWKEVNNRRVELGVNPLSQRDELCTIAAIRLNQILELGKLDGHEGFDTTIKREDLKWISEKYNLSEFLVAGYQTPLESVKAWENTLGHKKLLSGGEYVWGCIYAQAGYGVAIAAY